MGTLREQYPEGTISVGNAPVDSFLQRIILLLHTHTGHDFSLYKENTLCSRIERRMAIHRINEIGHYVRFLQENLQERDFLFKEVLIGVTRFFRDPAAWEYLQTEILPTLLASRPDGAVIRAWVPGCSTGEEAFSLAMICREALDRVAPDRHFTFRIFATDLDRDAIDRARRGVYPSGIAADVTADRLQRFFVREKKDGTYRVSDVIREMVTPAPHNLLTVIPFSGLDLLVCRNLLIYLKSETQKKLLPLFHGCLRPDGVLFLGSDETIGSCTGLFTPWESTLRLYRPRESNGQQESAVCPALIATSLPNRVGAEEIGLPVANIQALADRYLLHHVAPAAVLINGAGDIIYTSGRTEEYLTPAAGRTNINIFALSHKGFGSALIKAMEKASRRRKPTFVTNLDIITSDHQYRSIDLVVQAMDTPKELAGLYFVIFRECSAFEKATRARIEELQAQVDDLHGMNKRMNICSMRPK